jgi:hypothetical protein
VLYPTYKEVVAKTVRELPLHPSKFAARLTIRILFVAGRLVYCRPGFGTEYRCQNKGI